MDLRLRRIEQRVGAQVHLYPLDLTLVPLAVTVLLGDGALGAEVAPGLFEAELCYLYGHEWARCAEDVLWRRTKLGLHFSAADRAAVARWCAAHWPSVAASADDASVSIEERAWS